MQWTVNEQSSATMSRSQYVFSSLDEIMPHLTMSVVYGFTCDDSRREAIRQNLTAGLQKTYEKLPFLAGDVLRQTRDVEANGWRPGGLRLHAANDLADIDMEVKDLTSGWEHTYSDLQAQGMPMSMLDPANFIPGGSYDATESTKFFRGRVTFIPGGCFVAASSNHAYVDAWGFSILMKMWADEARALQDPSFTPLEIPVFEPSALPAALAESRSFQDYQSLKHKPESWKLLGLDWRKLTETRELAIPYASIPQINTSIFVFSSESQERVHEDGTPDEDDFQDEDAVWVSPNDALVALLWRCIMKARAPSWMNKQHKRDSMVSVAINGRRALYPPIPMDYIGNVVFCCLTELPIQQVIAPRTTLASLAVAVRRSVEKSLDTQILAQAVALSSCIPDVRALGNAFTGWFAEDLVTTSVVDLPSYRTSWGDLLGAPEFVRLPKGQFGGICMLQPRRLDGSVEVFISLEEDEMRRLRADGQFNKYAQFVSS